MPSRTIRLASGEPMLPRPATSTSAVELMGLLLVFRPPRRGSVKGGRMLAETAGRRVDPAGSRPPAVLCLGDLVEPPAATGTLNCQLVVPERTTADRAG